MCNNRKYDKEEQEKLCRLGRMSALFLRGYSLEEIAEQEGKTVDEVTKLFEDIKPINPYLYKQVKEKMAN